METWRIVSGCIVGFIAIALVVYVSFTIRCRGPIFSNSYLWLSKEERKKADKKAEYKLVTVVFACLAAVFALLSLHIFTLWKLPYILMWFVIGFVIVYAIVDAVKTEKRKYRK
ncbi:DUF3784 domain-containing protein [Clostridium perfringens]|uniref:DUF3784 domain-containing protein n=1 Tax=Clostridium perfringens TaxID=1502 RepID=A0AAW9IGM4_CLOPF|nr:DUF3784 domain-containing protein [Clostridium perfringens]MDZ5000940.1 DUF3784 domain-containing protein [Clostridium perfringens]